MKNKQRENPIGIFDSGIGGLTVLKEIRRILPKENIIYLGDTKNLPYGVKSKSTIIDLTVRNILFLLKKKVKLVIIACNTASSVAIPKVRDFFSIPLCGVVEAGAEAALAKTKNFRIGVIGTNATIRSGAYDLLLRKYAPGVKILRKNCPLFVPLVEEGWAASTVAHDVAEAYLASMKGKIDTLILGCTHYPLLAGVIKKVLPSVTLVNSALEIAYKVRNILQEQGLANISGRKPELTFCLTDDSPNFPGFTHLVLRERFKPQIVNNV